MSFEKINKLPRLKIDIGNLSSVVLRQSDYYTIFLVDKTAAYIYLKFCF